MTEALPTPADLAPKDRALHLMRTLPVAHRIAVGAAVIVVVLAGVLFMRWIASPSYSVLASGVAADDLAEITAELDSSGIGYQVENGGERVMVAKQDLARARGSLAGAGIATDQASSRDRGYEILDEQGFGLSSNLERVNVQRALEGELARSVRAMQLVDDAVVHLVLPDDELFGDPDAASASVIVDVTDAFGTAEAAAVANLVAGAVDNLDANAVTVIDLQGRTLLAPSDDGSPIDAGTSASQTSDFEKRLESDITRLLLSAGAGDRSTVMVQATLDFDQVSRRTETYQPDSQIALREAISTEQFSGDADLAPGGVPGVDGEQIEEVLDEDGSGIAYTRNDTTTEFGVDNIVTNEIVAGGEVEELHIGVVIDDGSLTGAAVPDTNTISNLIANSVGIDEARGDSIVVVGAAFPALDETEPLAIGAAATGDAASSPLDLIPQAVGGLVLLVVLIVVILMLRSAGREPEELPPLELDAPPSGWSLDQLEAGGELSEQQQNQADPAAEVRQLVERQPEEIAGLLRSWLADA